MHSLIFCQCDATLRAVTDDMLRKDVTFLCPGGVGLCCTFSQFPVTRITHNGVITLHVAVSHIAQSRVHCQANSQPCGCSSSTAHAGTRTRSRTRSTAHWHGCCALRVRPDTHDELLPTVPVRKTLVMRVVVGAGALALPTSCSASLRTRLPRRMARRASHSRAYRRDSSSGPSMLA